MTSPSRPADPAAMGAEAILKLDTSRPHPARMYDYLLLRHEALRYRVEVRDLHRWAVAAA